MGKNSYPEYSRVQKHKQNSIKSRQEKLGHCNGSVKLIGHGLIAVIVLGGSGIIAIISALKTVPIIVIGVNNKTYKLRVIKSPDKLKELLDILGLNKIEVKRGDLHQ